MPRLKPEKIEPLDCLGFQLLNPVKVAKALEKLGDGATEEKLLAEYDKLGGAIKKGLRLITIGAFYDFTSKEPKKDLDYETLGDDSFEDEYVLVRKKKEQPKKVTHKELTDKIKKLKKSEIDGDGESNDEIDEEQKPKRGRPKKNEE